MDNYIYNKYCSQEDKDITNTGKGNNDDDDSDNIDNLYIQIYIYIYRYIYTYINSVNNNISIYLVKFSLLHRRLFFSTTYNKRERKLMFCKIKAGRIFSFFNYFTNISYPD